MSKFITMKAEGLAFSIKVAEAQLAELYQQAEDHLREYRNLGPQRDIELREALDAGEPFTMLQEGRTQLKVSVMCTLRALEKPEGYQ